VTLTKHVNESILATTNLYVCDCKTVTQFFSSSRMKIAEISRNAQISVRAAFSIEREKEE
jgi:hypothetical protein